MRSLQRSCCNMRFAWRPELRRALLTALAAASVACSGTPKGPFIRVTIPQGASFRVAADSLHNAGFVEFPRLFRFYAQLTGRDRDIKAGTYVLERNASWNEVLW